MENAVNITELKGVLHELIVRLDDEELLLKAYKKLVKLVDKHEATLDEEFELPPYALKELDKAIEEAENPENLIPHEEVIRKYKKWLK